MLKKKKEKKRMGKLHPIGHSEPTVLYVNKVLLERSPHSLVYGFLSATKAKMSSSKKDV